MKKITKNRIVMATLVLLLTIISAFVSGGLTICIIQFFADGMQAPKVGWSGLFIIWGFNVFIAVGPALLFMIIFSIIKYSSFKLRILFNVIMAFILSSIAVITIIVIGLAYTTSYFVAGLSCLIIVIVAEMLMKNSKKLK